MIRKASEAIDLNYIRSLANKIKEKFHPQKIILFGSYAYGTPQKGSDLDFLVVMDTDLKPYKQSAIIRQALDESFGVLFPIDIIVRTPAEMQKRMAEGDFFIRHILAKGMFL